jgi:hypothetical protein
MSWALTLDLRISSRSNRQHVSVGDPWSRHRPWVARRAASKFEKNSKKLTEDLTEAEPVVLFPLSSNEKGNEQRAAQTAREGKTEPIQVLDRIIDRASRCDLPLGLLPRPVISVAWFL